MEQVTSLVSTRMDVHFQVGKQPTVYIGLLPSLAWSMTTGQSAVILCSWRVKAGWLILLLCKHGWASQVKLWSIINACHRDECIIKLIKNVAFTLLIYLLGCKWRRRMMMMWQAMQAGWAAHEDKLRLVESLCCKLEDICSQDAQSMLHEAASAVADNLHCLQRKCRQIVERLENHRESLRAYLHEQTPAADVDDTFLNTNRFVVQQ